MTDRVLPAPLVGRPGLGRLREPDPAISTPPCRTVAVPQLPLGTQSGVLSGTKAIRAANRKGEAILTTPARAGMLIGMSAAVYAVSLAAVAGLQFQAEAAAAAAQAPMVGAVERTRAANDAVEAVLLAADAQARELEAQYASVGGDAADFQRRLDALAALVADVRGSAATLPSAITLPTVASHGAVTGSRKAPATAAVTSASGKP